MRRFSAALVIALVMLGTTAPSYAQDRDSPRRGRESVIVKIIRSITKFFLPQPDDDIGQPKP